MNTKKEFIDYILIFIGSTLLSIGVVCFLAPNKIATGGTAGLAIVLHFVTNAPIGVLMALINVPLLLASIKYLGKRFAIRTIVAISFIVLGIDFFNEIIILPVLSSNFLLATLYGGIIVGIGLGLIFRGGGSAGGGTILAKIISSKFKIRTGTVILLIDGAVVFLVAFVFKNIELALWSLISIYASSKLVDTILTGKPTQKIVHISSAKNLEVLSKNINETLGISGTIVHGNDLSIREHKDIIFIVVENSKLNSLKQLVYAFDFNARMIVMEASEMLE